MDYLSVVARNPMQGSRPAAFALSALFDKTLLPETEALLLPTLAKAVMHAVEETVVYAMQGVARFLWTSDRALALTCVQALVTQAMERHAFMERQRRQPFTGREPDEPFHNDLRLRLREFVADRKTTDEAEVAALDIAHWPGRTVARHLFGIATQNPNDPLLQQLMQRSAALLPAI